MARRDRRRAWTANPTAQADFDANLAAFDASLAPVLDTITTHQGEVPARARRVHRTRAAATCSTPPGSSSRSPSGFAQAIEEGNEPSPRDDKGDERPDHRVAASRRCSTTRRRRAR